jgi:hypothetical protein
MWRWVVLLLTIGVLPTNSASSGAMTPEERGEEIFREWDRRDSGFVDYQVALRMILRDARGDASERLLRIQTLEVAEDGDKIMIVFDTPKAIKGTALLSFSHPVDPDDQWLYLPAIKRVKRIASRNKSGPFLGSEFAFEDLTSQEVEKFTYRYIEDAEIDGESFFVVERVPIDEYSGYTRQLVWLDQAEYRTYRIEYYDRRGELLKTLASSDYQLHADRFWKPGRMVMENHQTKKSTELIWDSYRFATGLIESRDFTTNALKRVY